MKIGFTLAEVLITLVIIGVIAAITVPSLLQTTEDQEYVSGVKKAYSVLSQAYMRQKADGILPDEWGFSTADSRKMIEVLLPYLNYTKVCYGAEAHCHNRELTRKDGVKMSGGINHGIFGGTAKRSGVILADGMMIGSLVLSDDCTNQMGDKESLQHQCGEYMVDVNGEKGPNKYGKDIFIFVLTIDGIMPTGLDDFENSAQSNWSYAFEAGCLASDAKGGGCSAWVLANSNLDYLYCPSKIRQGKTSCK